jgi:hypothetical protein
MLSSRCHGMDTSITNRERGRAADDHEQQYERPCPECGSQHSRKMAIFTMASKIINARTVAVNLSWMLPIGWLTKTTAPWWNAYSARKSPCTVSAARSASVSAGSGTSGSPVLPQCRNICMCSPWPPQARCCSGVWRWRQTSSGASCRKRLIHAGSGSPWISRRATSLPSMSEIAAVTAPNNYGPRFLPYSVSKRPSIPTTTLPTSA